MVRPVLFFVALALAGCTAPAYTCGHPVPCARGSVQSCTSRDGSRCRYLLGDGTPVECAACDDCFAAEREISAWCAGADPVGSNGGSGGSSSPADFSAPDDSRDMSVEPRDMSVEPRDMSVADPPDLSRPRDLAGDEQDFSMPSGDLAGYFDTDLGCYAFGYACNNDPSCCQKCCAGGCAVFGFCALQ